MTYAATEWRRSCHRKQLYKRTRHRSICMQRRKVKTKSKYGNRKWLGGWQTLGVAANALHCHRFQFNIYIVSWNNTRIDILKIDTKVSDCGLSHLLLLFYYFHKIIQAFGCRDMSDSQVTQVAYTNTMEVVICRKSEQIDNMKRNFSPPVCREAGTCDVRVDQY